MTCEKTVDDATQAISSKKLHIRVGEKKSYLNFNG
jgi:hypothetical protein